MSQFAPLPLGLHGYGSALYYMQFTFNKTYFNLKLAVSLINTLHIYRVAQKMFPFFDSL